MGIRRTTSALVILAAALAACGGGAPPSRPAAGGPAHPVPGGPNPPTSLGSGASTTGAGPSASTPGTTPAAPAPASPVSNVSTAPAPPFVTPIRPDNTPTPVPGETNGEMPARDLVWVAPDCQAYRAAAPSLGLLLAAAREEGLSLRFEECYRPLSDQVAVRQTWTSAGNSACAAPVTTSSSGTPKGTSMHGWGKAADLSYAGRSVSFGSPGYAFLTANAGRFGWNHPAWAQPGGSACPEAWHWEWVGDGGTRHDSPVRADVVAVLPGPTAGGYATVTGLGAVNGRGDDSAATSPAIDPLGAVIVGAATTPDGRGRWLAGADGGVLTSGTARYFGSQGGQPRSDPVVGLAPSAGGSGYWLVTAAGRVTAYGAARDLGSLPSPSGKGAPVVAITPSPSGRGYWLATATGGVYTFGDATFRGAVGHALPAPVVGMAATPDGRGYWLVGSDGSVYPFGDARSFGDRAGSPLAEPVVGMAATPDGSGYWLVAAGGGVFTFGDAGFYGAG